MELKELIPIGLFFITVVGIIGSFFKAKGMDEVQQRIIDDKLKVLHEIDDQQWKRIDELRMIDAAHEKEDWKMRSELELKVAGQDGTIGKLSGKLDSIEKKLDTLIVNFEKRISNN